MLLAAGSLSVACSKPDLISDLQSEGPPEITEVNTTSETSLFGDPTGGLLLGEWATFCREGDQYKVNSFYCPLARDATDAPIPGDRAIDPDMGVVPFYGPSFNFVDIWHVRVIFDELLDPSIETLHEDADGVYGTLEDTQPVSVVCNDTPVAYDGFYDPTGNSESYPPGPALVISSLEFVATGSSCYVTLDGGQTEVTDKDGNSVPSEQASAHYAFGIAPLEVYSTTPADMEEGVDPTAPVDIEFSAPIDIATVDANVTVEDAGGSPVAGTWATLEGDGEPNWAEFTPDAALDAGATYTVVVADGVADVAGGPFPTDATGPIASFTTAP